MPVSKEKKLAAWMAALREGRSGVRARFDEWKDAVREEPALLWATPAIRYGVYGLGGLLAVWVLTWGLGLFVPAKATPPAKTADFHVLCTASGCGHHFVIREKFGFHHFPVVCPKCQQQTGQRATRCSSKTCHGRWVAPLEQDHEYRCPYCTGYLGKVD
jgi:hypothetical protein